MHRFPNKSVIFRFKLAALLLCAKCLLVPVVVGLLVYSLVTNDLELTRITIWAAALVILINLLLWLLAWRTRCTLCLTPVLAANHCAKHRSSRRFMGSYRLPVAISILFRGSFRCPYCNEPSAMEVRVRGQRSGARYL